MLSVVIATKDSERALVPTLAALVPGATAGLVSEVLIADGGSRDDTTAVAEHAGCNFLVMEAPLAQRLNAAAERRARNGCCSCSPLPCWMQHGSATPSGLPRWSSRGRRRGVSPWRADARRSARRLVVARDDARPPSPPRAGTADREGSFTSKLGGHSETATDPERDLIRRIGRRRLTTLPTIAYRALRYT